MCCTVNHLFCCFWHLNKRLCNNHFIWRWMTHNLKLWVWKTASFNVTCRLFLCMAPLTGQLCRQLVLSHLRCVWVHMDIPNLEGSLLCGIRGIFRKPLFVYARPSPRHPFIGITSHTRAVAASITCHTAAVAAHPCTSVITRGEDGWCCSTSRRWIWMSSNCGFSSVKRELFSR